MSRKELELLTGLGAGMSFIFWICFADWETVYRHFKILISEIMPIGMFFLIFILSSVSLILHCEKNHWNNKKINVLDVIKYNEHYKEIYFIVSTVGVIYASFFFKWKTLSVLIVLIFTIWKPILTMFNKEKETPPHKQKYIRRNKKSR